MDPPSYTEASTTGGGFATTIATPALAPRSIQDIRTLILGNANILRPRKGTETIELIVAKRNVPQASAEEMPRESHYAFLVTRGVGDRDIEILLKGKPRDTIEEALSEMLERSEVLMEEVLLRHGQHSKMTGCCLECTMMVRRQQ